MMVGRFFDLCRRRELKVNAGKSKVIIMNGEEGLECEVQVGAIHLDFRACIQIQIFGICFG